MLTLVKWNPSSDGHHPIQQRKCAAFSTLQVTIGGLASLFTGLLKKDVFRWTPQAQITFEALKDKFDSIPVLALPVF